MNNYTESLSELKRFKEIMYCYLMDTHWIHYDHEYSEASMLSYDAYLFLLRYRYLEEAPILEAHISNLYKCLCLLSEHLILKKPTLDCL
jgi:hypothetical protein